MFLRQSLPGIRRWLVVASLLAFSSAAWAGELVPVALRAAIIIRSAGYERGFSERSGGAMLVVVSGRSGASAEDGRAMASLLGKGGNIGGRPKMVVHVTHESTGKTVGELRNHRAEIVYFAEGLEGVIKDVPGQAGGVSRILVCANGADVRVGCTLGVELTGDKPRIVVNLKQANASGLRFEPEFLRLARIVR